MNNGICIRRKHYKIFFPGVLREMADSRIEAGNYKMILEHLVISEGKYQRLLGRVRRDPETNLKMLPFVNPL